MGVVVESGVNILSYIHRGGCVLSCRKQNLLPVTLVNTCKHVM